jgi:uracil-DNA glycosylase
VTCTPVHLSQVHAELPPWRRRERGAGLVLLVGEAPRPRWDGEEPVLMGRTGRRLALMAGLSFPIGYCHFFDRVNVLECRPIEELGEPWPAVEAHRRGELVYQLACCPNCWSPEAPEHRDVVVLGRRAWNAIGFGEELFYSHVRSVSRLGHSPRFWLLPHPSRRSRLWNLPETEERAGEILRLLVALREDEGLPVHRPARTHAGD